MAVANVNGKMVNVDTAAKPAATKTASSNEVIKTSKVSPYDYNARVNEINSMYDSYANAQKANLEAAYNQNISNLEANRNKIAQEYQTQRNVNAVNYRNFNQQASMNGLNTGAGSQAALAQNNMYQQGVAALGASEANANNDLNKSIADTKAKYEADVNEAIAKNDYNRAAALLDEYNNAYSQAMTKAQQMAQYGDFSGYADIYGSDAARQMKATWQIQNPLIAYNLGQISASKYKQITGSDPPGYDAGGGYYGGGGYGYRRSSKGGKGGNGSGGNSLMGEFNASLRNEHPERDKNGSASITTALRTAPTDPYFMPKPNGVDPRDAGRAQDRAIAERQYNLQQTLKYRAGL